MKIKGFSSDLPAYLIVNAKNGDKAAMEKIYRSYCDAAYRLALAICQNEASAQDIVQEGFIRALNNLNKYQERELFGAWLKKIFTNLTIDYLRKKNRINEEKFDCELYKTNELSNYQWLSQIEELSYYFGLLNTNQRLIAWLHIVEGYTHKEVGELLNKSDSYSKVVFHRAIDVIKTRVSTQAELVSCQ